MIYKNVDKRKIRSEISRGKILESAKELFIKYGFKETTITMISKNAEIGYGTTYTHFPRGKDDIFLTIMEEIMEEFYDIADNDYTVNSKEEAFSFTKKNIEEFLELAINHQKTLEVFHEAIGLSPIISEKWDKINDRFIIRISQNVKQVISKGLARNMHFDPEVVAGVLFYTGEKYMWKFALNKTSKDYKEIAKILAQMYTNGLYQ